MGYFWRDYGAMSMTSHSAAGREESESPIIPPAQPSLVTARGFSLALITGSWTTGEYSAL